MKKEKKVKEKKVKKEKKNNPYKKSLNRQMTFIFVVIMITTIAACLLVNSLLLEKFYVKNKQLALMEVYNRIATGVTNDELDSDSFELDMQRYAGTHNVSIVIIGSDLQIKNVYSNEPTAEIIMEMENNLLGRGNMTTLMAQTDDYVMVEKKDLKTNIEYIEMWGTLSDDSFFMMRTAVESIRESSALANRFFIYVGLTGSVISAIVIYFFTKRISRPVLKLADISEQMADMDFNAKYTGREKNEIGLLGNNINRLSSSLEETITELKAANEELKKDNELKTQIDEMRKEFISNVSHELKTPIALIQGYAEGLKEEVNEAEERDYYCDVIMDEASKMNIMVKKLLTLNQLEFGNYTVQPERFDICAVIRNYMQNSNILTDQANIHTSFPEGEAFVWADEFMVEEVFNNFFSNARNHCESDTEKRIDVSLEDKDNIVRINVFNTGKPIPEESIDHIWEKFYKVDKARTRAYGGSGVGLSIVKAIMDAHGQAYGVENREDGVNFWFELEKA